MRLNDPQPPFPLDPSGADDAPRPVAGSERARAESAAEKFEAFFIADMLHRMRRNAREFGDHDDSASSRSNADMLDLADTQVADVLAGQRAFGVADLILKQVLPTVDADAAKKSGDALNSPPPPVALNR
jgi:flagellar protein FlgJ